MSLPPVFKPVARQGTAHLFTPRLCAFEFAPSNASTTSPTHTIIFIGGLGDGLLTVPYAHKIASSLPPSWRLAHPLLSSSFDQWGFRTLASDATDLRACVAYFRELRPGTKIVLMGHSTGCQDCMEYILGPQNTDASSGGVKQVAVDGDERDTHVDGVILQASVSDREVMADEMDPDTLRVGIKTAQNFVAREEPDEIIPTGATAGFFGEAPVTARRWLSLASPDKKGEDDFFSSDLPDEQLAKTFGAWPKSVRLMFCYSGADAFVPKHVDKEALVSKWEGFVKGAGATIDEDSGVVPGAGHNLKRDPESVVDDLVGRVIRFLGRVEKHDGVEAKM